MLPPPKTSYEWNQLLELLKAGTHDSEVLAAMEQGSLEWIGGVAPIFVRNLLTTADTRLQQEVKKFQQSFTYVGSQEGLFVLNLRRLKQEMQFLYRLVSLKCIPQEERTKYQKIIQDNADKIQDNLEKSSAVDRTGRIAYIIKNNKINNLGA